MGESVQLHLNRAATDALMQDEGVRVKLSQQVIEHVVSRHVIKSIASNPDLARLADGIRAEINKHALKTLEEVGFNAAVTEGSRTRVLAWRVSDNLQTMIRTGVGRAIENEVAQQAEAVLNALPSIIEKQVRQYVNDVLADQVNRAVQDTVQKAIKAAFKETP